MRRYELPVVNCDGCGECCTSVGTPPAFYPAYASPEWDGVALTDAEDYQHWLGMPETLRQELAAYYRYAHTTRVNRDGMPCIWLDEQTRRCGHYDHRPQACREFEVGSEDCLAYRQKKNNYRKLANLSSATAALSRSS